MNLKYSQNPNRLNAGALKSSAGRLRSPTWIRKVQSIEMGNDGGLPLSDALGWHKVVSEYWDSDVSVYSRDMDTLSQQAEHDRSACQSGSSPAVREHRRRHAWHSAPANCVCIMRSLDEQRLIMSTISSQSDDGTSLMEVVMIQVTERRNLTVNWSWTRAWIWI